MGSLWALLEAAYDKAYSLVKETGSPVLEQNVVTIKVCTEYTKRKDISTDCFRETFQ